MSDPGALPELAWLPVDKLAVDHRYQRTLESRRSQALIQRIATNFRWAMFQAILSTPDGKGGWLVIDGQHRAEGARQAGITHVPAVVIEAVSLAEQASAFVGANQARVSVNLYALYHAKLAAGDELAEEIAALCENARISIPHYPIPADKIKAGETLAVTTLANLLKRYGPRVARLATTAVAEAYRLEPGGLRAVFFHAAGDILKEASPGDAGALSRRITEALKRAPWQDTERAVTERRHKYGGVLYMNAIALIKSRLGALQPVASLVDRQRLMAGR